MELWLLSHKSVVRKCG